MALTAGKARIRYGTGNFTIEAHCEVEKRILEQFPNIATSLYGYVS
jgi:hypothetical protein